MANRASSKKRRIHRNKTRRKYSTSFVPQAAKTVMREQSQEAFSSQRRSQSTVSYVVHFVRLSICSCVKALEGLFGKFIQLPKIIQIILILALLVLFLDHTRISDLLRLLFAWLALSSYDNR
jgi:hypothetical protein